MGSWAAGARDGVVIGGHTASMDIELSRKQGSPRSHTDQPTPRSWWATSAESKQSCKHSPLIFAIFTVAVATAVLSSAVLYFQLTSPHTFEPPISGIIPGRDKPKIILAQDVDWPPYAYVATPPEGDFDVAGFGHDVAKGLESVCDIEVVTRQAAWSQCWGSDAIGDGLDGGLFHGCMTYTHTAGVRNRYVDFSYGILSANKPAGILTRLGSDGKPFLDPMSDLSGKKIVDVKGWAPTADGLSLVNNWCTNTRYTGYEVITPATDGNDAAMAMLRDGTADGMFVYADQAYNYRPNQADVTSTWNEAMWTGLGTKFAYIGTGMLGHSYNGTTLAISKKGSGLNAIINPCIKKFMETKAYHDVCKKHEFEASCYPNAFFPPPSDTSKPWMIKTNEQPANSCSTGYCDCAAGVSLGADDLVTFSI